MSCKHVKSSPALRAAALALLGLTLQLPSRTLPSPRAAPAEAAVARQGNDAAPRLSPGERVERELSAGESHDYQVTLEAGQYFRAAVEQRGVDARVSLAAPDGHTVVQLDCRRRRPTPVSIIADLSGTYRLEVRSLEEKGARGRYELRVTEIRPAAADDKYRTAAENSFAAGEQLLKDETAESARAAIDKYRDAASSWRAVGDRREEARALLRIGDAYSSLSEYRPALSYYNRALSADREKGDRAGEAGTLNAIAYVYLTLGQNGRALALCELALRLSRGEGDRVSEAEAINNIGEIRYGLGALPRSVDFFKQALPLWRELGDRRGQALALLNLGYTYSDLGQAREAFDSYNEALALWQAAGDRRGEAATLTAIGRIYSRVGESQEALDFFERALPAVRRAGNPVEEARVLTGIAYVYGRVGQERQAIDYYERALGLFRSAGYPNGEAATLYSAGRVYYSLGDNRKALEYHRRALAISGAIGDHRLEMIEIKEIGRLYDSAGNSTAALKNYLLALSFEHVRKDRREETDTLNLLGRVYEARGRARQALSCYESALPLGRAAEYPFGAAAALYNLARVERGLGELARARARTEEALGVVESLRAKVSSQDLRASYFASVRQLYELYIDLLMELHRLHPADGYDAAAFEASERARARSLLETLEAARVGVRDKAGPGLLARERALRGELGEKVERRMRLPAGPQSEAEAAALTKEIDEITMRYREVSAQVRAVTAEYTAQNQPRPLTLGEVRARDLDGDTLLLEFSLGEERSYLWLVSKDSLKSYELPPRAEIEAAAGRVRGLLVAPAPAPGESFDERQARLKDAEAAYWREAAALSGMLLAPAAAELGERRLLVVADGALQYIPFGALPAPGRGGEAPPLLVEHEVTHEPSASALATLRGVEVGRRPAAKSVAVFADPVFGADDPRLAPGRGSSAEAAPARSRGEEPAGLLRDAIPAWGGVVPRLPASLAEAEAIMAETAGGENLKAVGFDADKAAATGPELGQYRVIHFATHGVLDSDHPELSGLLLSRFDSAGRPKEGFLRLDDIYNLNLPAELVVLSACDSGLGKDVRGEGLVGLVRGFMYAGSTRVVASLWKVDDNATAELMSHFYREMLGGGKSPAAALREAQIAMWRERRWRAPYYWAAFVLQGEYAGRVEIGRGPRGVEPRLLAGAALAASLCCLFAWLRAGRKKRV